MARKGRAVVAIDYKGEIVGAYDNVSEAAQINGSHKNNIYKALSERIYHRKVLWMWEEDYRDYWMEGKTDELRNSFRAKKRKSMQEAIKRRTEEKTVLWKSNISASRKKYIKENPDCMPKRNKKVLCVTTGKTYESATALAKELGVPLCNVSQSIRQG